MFSSILRKPELWFQPRYYLERLLRRSDPGVRLRDHPLPWGLTLRIDLDDTIGRQVDAFEPNPKVLGLLRSHCDLWRRMPSLGSIHIHPLALSRSTGTVQFYDSVEDPHNCGLGSLVEGPGKVRTFEIPTARWDEVMDPHRPIGLAKLDVEGAELLVLEGASAVLEAKSVRDLHFEDYEPYPSRTARFLEGFGYTILALGTRLMGPSLTPAAAGLAPLRPWDSPNFLATTDPQRALKRLHPRGWRVLSRTPVSIRSEGSGQASVVRGNAS